MAMAVGWFARGACSILFAGDFFFNFYTLLFIYNAISISFDNFYEFNLNNKY